MVDAKQGMLGFLAAWHLSGIVANMPFTAHALDPQEINPFPPAVTSAAREAIERVRAFIARRRIAALAPS